MLMVGNFQKPNFQKPNFLDNTSIILQNIDQIIISFSFLHQLLLAISIVTQYHSFNKNILEEEVATSQKG